ncbi:MAG: hypothetical protein IPP80_01225 [Ignavibacteria bacterium]|nr:hypothetical protein [Ignavibacteria bacterium]
MTRKRSRRWFFVTLVVLALLYLVLIARVFLLEADMSLGLSRISGPGLQGLIVDRSTYVPPKDSVVQPGQLSMLVDVVETLDSLRDDSADTLKMRTSFADLLNRYTISLSEYRWVRSVVSGVREQEVSRKRRTRADSTNTQRLRMFLPRLEDHGMFFRDTLDREALVQ